MEKFFSKSLVSFLIVFLGFSQAPAFSGTLSTCSEIVKEVYQYDKTYDAKANPLFPFSWQDMKWLQVKLGPARSIKRYKTEDRRYVQHDWDCKDTGSTLTITSDDNDEQQIRSYQGTYCPLAATKEHCRHFNALKLSFPRYKDRGAGFQQADLYIQHPPLKPQFTEVQAIEIAKKQTLQTLKKQFNWHIQAYAQVPSFVTQSLTHYYTQLRSCIPGKYYYASPFILGGRMLSNIDVAPYYFVATSKIQGLREGKCVVETKAIIGKNQGVLVCQFSAENLGVFTNEQAQLDAVALNHIDDNHVAQAKALLKECQLYMNGALTIR